MATDGAEQYPGAAAVWRMLCLVLPLALTGPRCAQAEQNGGVPGDYGYRHEEYHRRGIVDELERKVGHSCCDRLGECRATYVNMAARKALIDSRWCPIGYRTVIRYDVILPDHFALVCAGQSGNPANLNPCPPIFCVALSPGL